MATLTGRLANLMSRRLPRLGNAGTRNHVKRYRESGGSKGSTLRGRPVFLLDVTGRRSGEPRPVMLMLIRRGDDLLVCGSNGGNPTTPNWYRNLVAAGRADVQVGAERWPATFRELDGAERSQAWALLLAGYSDFGSYQELTDRLLPVGVLERESA